MKINLPVTNNEKDIRADHNILSTTDLKGAITYVNPDFVEISGFTVEELLGKNHNIVRHPDMPPIAFKSLWSHVKAGQAWMGMVKNRCKDGDHYWVDAFVMPIQKDGVAAEYQSVRSKPEKVWVDRAESIYKSLHEGKAFKVGLAARLSLTGKLIVGNLLALAPTAIFFMLPSLSSMLPVGILLSAAASMVVNVGLLRPLRHVIAKSREIFDEPAMRRIYTGRDDEFGQILLALQMQKSQINAIVGRLSDTTAKLSQAALVTAEASDHANHGVEAQQRELEQVATAMTEMVATVQEIARSSATAAESAVSGQRESSAGAQVVKQTIAAIDSLAGEVQAVSEVIETLSEQSTDIVKVLDVIKGIAEQTNLLALNAAIEAARAGENGRGFAVVADEVRALASRTTDSAREIEEMIGALRSGSRRAVSVMDQGRKGAKNTVDLAAKARSALEAISGAIDSITDMNHQIATASEEQSAVAEDINRNIVNISEVAQATAQGALKSVESSVGMTDAIRRLDNLVSQFRR